MSIVQYLSNTGIPFCVLIAVMVSPSNAGAVEQSPVFGGSGGDKAYMLNCGPKAAVIGLNGRVGLYVDQFGIICRKIRADGSLGEIFTKGPVGGMGGKPSTARCKPKYVAAGVDARSYYFGPVAGPIEFITLICQRWSFSNKLKNRNQEHLDTLNWGLGSVSSKSGGSKAFRCNDSRNVVRGFRGRYGAAIDSLQALCDSYNK